MIINIELSSQIKFRKSELTEGLINQIRSYLTMDNPKYMEAKERGYYTGGFQQYLFACSEDKDYFYAYRGYLGSLLPFLSRSGYQYQIIDHRRRLPDINLTFQGTLRPYQQRAVDEALSKDFGVVVAPCGSGKTVMTCRIMAERKQPTLIIVHTKELLVQWCDRITQYLGLSLDEIGVIGSGKEILRPVTVGMVQTLCKRDMDDISQYFGQIIVDENQHCPASTFTEVITFFDCQYMLGLSATPYRRDRLDKLIFLSGQCRCRGFKC